MPRSTIIGAGRCALEASSRRLAMACPSPSPSPARAFSSTAARNAHIQSFTPSSTPEIDAILDKIRRKIILPAYLSHRERKQLNSPRYQRKLQSDPIIMEIDEEIHKFYYLNPLGGGVPNSEKTAMQAVNKFRTDEDFANLRPLLEGLQVAGRTFSVAFWTKLARISGIRGHIYDILDCARSVKTTGYKLDTSEKVNEILHFIQLKAADAGWDKAETGQAFRWAKMVYGMLPVEEHQLEPVKLPGGRVAPRVDMPLDRDPQVIMAPLHLAAALVVKCGVESESLKEAVADYARDLVKLWPAGQSLRAVHPAEAYADFDRMGYLLEPNKFLTLAVPLLHGLQLAAQAVPDPALADELKARFENLSAEIEQARPDALKEGKRGEAVYKKFYPS